MPLKNKYKKLTKFNKMLNQFIIAQYIFKKYYLSYQEYLIIATGIKNFLFNIYNMIKLLYSSIINYKTVYKPTFTINYI